MRLFELYNTSVFEARAGVRRGAQVDERLSGHKAAADFLKQTHDMKHYGVSMTKLPKLGLNPQSKYHTPLGIYFYPAEHYYEYKSVEPPHELEFQDDAAYIQIFKIGGNILYLDEVDYYVYHNVVKKMYSVSGSIAEMLGLTKTEVDVRIAQSMMDADSYSKKKSYGGLLWYVMYDITGTGKSERRRNMAPRSAVMWNKIIRLLGIDVIIDRGEGIIYSAEPYQGVVLNPTSIKHVESIPNKNETPGARYFKLLANEKVDENYVASTIHTVFMHDLVFEPAYKKYIDQIFRKMFEALKKYPEFNGLGFNDMRTMEKIADPKTWNNIKGRLMAIKFVNRFKKIKSRIEFGLNVDHLEYKPGSGFENTFNYTMDDLDQIINVLKNYTDDPEIAEIVKYCKDAYEKFVEKGAEQSTFLQNLRKNTGSTSMYPDFPKE